jgi:mono/diheme cytochrome c family protein
MTRFLTTALILAAFSLPSVAFAGDVAAGNATFQATCVSCHGTGGKGDGPTGLALAASNQPTPRDFTVGDFKFDTDDDGTPGTDVDLKNVIKEGAGRYGGFLLMAANPALSDADLDNLVAFIRSLKME